MTSHHDAGLCERLRVNTCRYADETEEAAAKRRIATDLAAADLLESQAKALSEARALATQLSDALLKVRPLGGSELFIKRNGKYYADPKYCGDAIEERSAAYHKAMKESVRERKRAVAAEARLAEAMRVIGFYADRRRYEGPNLRPIPDDPFAKPDAVYIHDVTRDGGANARAFTNAAKTQESKDA